ncbi:DGAT1/2-independent enzyme synthesizing storage lipids-like [Tiliqua scincoides]|uniref:DGAT1/2-independent enzyme synthesizing storage lipids-like n=1 Tax=Tiliqua scincoides TaxID=71010 RepID=UPI003461C0F1
MTAKDTNFTLGEGSTSWLICTLENSPVFSLYWLGLVTVVILYCPVVLLFVWLSCCSICIKICKITGILPVDPDSEQWRKLLQIHAFLISMLGKVLHGYEVYGMENLPKGPSILVYFHGGIPMDSFYFLQEVYRMTGRAYLSVMDHIFFLIPGVQTYITLLGGVHPSREECVDLLKEGHAVNIAPGGLREQNYSDKTYKLIWGKRHGFAQIAIKAKVPIIPYFTMNIQEAYRVWGNTWITRWLYERTRLLVFPVLGPLPVKLRTYIGEPIPYDPNITPEELFEKAKAAVEALRDKHQKIPGSIPRALWERFEVHRKEE